MAACGPVERNAKMSSKGRKGSAAGGSRFAPCPVCGKSVAIALVHEHLNVCLLKIDEDDRKAVSGGERFTADCPNKGGSQGGVESHQAVGIGIEATSLDWNVEDNAASCRNPERDAKRRKLVESSQAEEASVKAVSGPLLQMPPPTDSRQQGALKDRCNDAGGEGMEGPECTPRSCIETEPQRFSEGQTEQRALTFDSCGLAPSQIGDLQEEPALHCDAQDEVERAAPTNSYGGECSSGFQHEHQTKRPTPTFIAPIFTKPNKVIYLIRHGNTMSNSGAAFRPFNVQDEIAKDEAEPTTSAVAARTDASGRIFDVPLSALGLKQAAALQKTLPGLRPNVILVSPLTRALQTCREALGGLQVPVEVTARHAEHVACCGDVGRPPNVLATEFPAFDLSLLPSLWWYSPPGAPNHALSGTFLSRESMGHLRERVQRFRAYLQQRPERTLVVIGHSTFFRELLGSKRRMAHCEVAQLRL